MRSNFFLKTNQNKSVVKKRVKLLFIKKNKTVIMMVLIFMRKRIAKKEMQLRRVNNDFGT